MQRISSALFSPSGRWFLVGAFSYLLLGLLVIPLFIGAPLELTLQGDSGEYSRPAIQLLQHGFYSIDGVAPYMAREPGMSFFLAALYAFFGVENALAIVLVQALLLFISASYFCRELEKRTSVRIAGITFLLLLTSGSIFHSTFLAYRESITLSGLLFLTGALLSHWRSPAWWKLCCVGIGFGAVILTYYTFLFFLPAFLVLSYTERRPLREGVTIIVLACLTVLPWALRNAAYGGTPRIIDAQRTGVMWYVRGEQAERVRGIEPLWCLYAEYISRDWTGRSDACSYNALLHARWPDGMDVKDDRPAIARAGREKIKKHFLSYLNFSLYEVIELHIPFIGGGFPTRFNLFGALSAGVLYLGFLFGIPALFQRKYLLWTAFIAYNTLIFILTDATPRYLVPVLFSYSVIAAIGYDALLRFFITKKTAQ